MLDPDTIVYGKVLLALELSRTTANRMAAQAKSGKIDATSLLAVVTTAHEVLQAGGTGRAANPEMLRMYQMMLQILENERNMYQALSAGDIQTFNELLGTGLENVKLIQVAAQRLQNPQA